MSCSHFILGCGGRLQEEWNDIYMGYGIQVFPDGETADV
jgi:hypothetical protein